MGDASTATAATYVTYFHEGSHGVDFVHNNPSKRYISPSGDSLDKCLQDEVKGVIKDYAMDAMKDTNYSDEKKQQMVDQLTKELMNTTTYDSSAKPTFNGNSEMRALYDEVVNQARDDFKYSRSDIYGGYTGDTFRGNWGHDTISQKRDGTYYSYWIEGTVDSAGTTITPNPGPDGNVQYTGAQQKEFFAESMAANMTRNETDLNDYNAYGDETKDMFNEILQVINDAS